jgi:hypothetical protein
MGTESIDGVYKARSLATSMRWGSSGTGNDQGAIDVSLPSLGLTGTVILPLTEKSAPFTFDRLKALGWDGKTFDSDGFPTIKEDRDVFVMLRTETYDGKTQLRFELFSGRVEIQTFKPEERKAAGGVIQKMLQKAESAPRTRAPRANAAQGRGMPDDDRFD